MKQWSTCKLGEVASSAATGPFGSAVSAKHFVLEGVPMLRGSNLSDDVGTRIDSSDLVFLPESIVEQFPRAIARAGDLVFTCWGTIGQIGLLDGREPYERFLVSNKQMRLRPNSEVVDPTFLYYYLSQPWMMDLVRGQAIGSSVPGFNLGQLRSLPVAYPPLVEQQAIAEVLGALDDKIAANTAAAAAADALLATMFRVRLHQTEAHDKELAAIANVVLGGTPSRARPDYWADGTIPWLNSGAVNATRIIEPSELITQVALANSAAKLMPSGATLLAITGATLGQIARLEISASGNQSIVGVWSDDVELNTWLYFAVQARLGWLLARTTGAAQQHVSKGDVEQLAVPVPSQAVLMEFSSVAAPLLELAAAAERESLTLAATRDALLPQLMSGTLRVRDAEAAASEAGA